jgi:hypothetical protein
MKGNYVTMDNLKVGEGDKHALLNKLNYVQLTLFKYLKTSCPTLKCTYVRVRLLVPWYPQSIHKGKKCHKRQLKEMISTIMHKISQSCGIISKNKSDSLKIFRRT